MRKLSFIALVALVALLLSAGAAYANFGPHGGYATDTDACAGCHRAHTSFSTLGWTDAQDTPHASALLVSNASTMSQFCYACHGDAAPGASTNVQSGLFDSGPTAQSGVAAPAGSLLYMSNSSFNATLNGGGFDRVGGTTVTVSTHGMEANNAPTWGDVVGGIGMPGTIGFFRCTSCHDPHGSSNYRLLKDYVNGHSVGGYDKVTPDPWVISNEEGFPQGGWKRGVNGVAQMAIYKPNYTTAEYSQLSGRSMSGWCAACHTQYIVRNDAVPNTDPWGAVSPTTYNYNNPGATGGPIDGEALVDGAGNPVAGARIGALPRHRHPIDVPLSLGQQTILAGRALNVAVLNDDGLPLEMQWSAAQTAVGSNHTSTKPWANDSVSGMSNGNVTCLTCHRAHGTEARMSGWAEAKLTTGTLNGPIAVPGAGGVNPNFSAALLRYPNRGVCERCHDK
ncbi:MAG TPA: cytochrome c3 family protein [Coriobacteriia bacterium]